MKRISIYVFVSILLFASFGAFPAYSAGPAITPVNDLDFQGVVKILSGIACLLLRAAAALLVIWGIWSAIKFMTAGGSAERQGAAQKTFLWYIIGGLILFAIPTILKLVVGALISIGVDIPINIELLC